MQLIYLVALLAIIVAINWRFLGLDRVFGFPKRDPQGCDWIRDDARETDDGKRHWVCMTCGARAAEPGRVPPRDCHRPPDRI